MWTVRFAYRGDHYITFANENGGDIVAFQSFQGIFKGRSYFTNQDSIIQLLNHIAANSNHRFLATLCLVNGTAKILSSGNIKKVIYWFNHANWGRANLYIRHSKINLLADIIPLGVAEFSNGYWNNQVVNFNIDYFFPAWRLKSLNEKLILLKQIIAKYC